MAEKTKYQNRIELLQGTLDMLVLHALQREPMHGYAIAQVIRQRSGEVLTAETGFSLPGAASTRTAEMGQVGMEADRKQAACKVLPAHSAWEEAAHCRLPTLA